MQAQSCCFGQSYHTVDNTTEGTQITHITKLIIFKVRRLHEERAGECAAEKDVFLASRGWLMNFTRHYQLF